MNSLRFNAIYKKVLSTLSSMEPQRFRHWVGGVGMVGGVDVRCVGEGHIESAYYWCRFNLGTKLDSY